MARHTTEVFDSQTMLAETGLDSDELGDRLNLAGALGILYLLPSFFRRRRQNTRTPAQVAVSATETPDARLTVPFSVLNGLLVRRGPGAVVCLCDKTQKLSDNVTALPVWDL